MAYNSQTPILGLAVSLFELTENWNMLDASINGGIPFSGTAPISGQVLTATLVGGVLTAVWTTPSGGGGGTPKLQTARSSIISMATNAVQPADTIGYLVNFPTAFADNNYTVQVVVVAGEASGTHTIAANPNLGVSLVTLQPGGVGVAVWLANNDSIPHNAIIHVTAFHD
jgi:hypothetical protein